MAAPNLEQEYDQTIGFMRITEIVWISDRDAGKLPYIDGSGHTYKYDADYLHDFNEFFIYFDYHDEHQSFTHRDAGNARMPKWLCMT